MKEDTQKTQGEIARELNRLTPSFYCYCDYSTHYGIHALAFEIKNCTFYFSYKTLIAFSGMINGTPQRVVSENHWSTTTGKHLNAIDPNKKTRVDSAEFNRLLLLMLHNTNKQ